jgi:hypothetical protein
MTDLDDQLNRVHTLVGRIATEFNSIEMLWYLIFTGLLAETPRSAVDAIFNQHKSGAAQRQLILDVTAALLPETSDLRKSIERLCARTRELSGRRNAVIHSAFYLAEFIIPPRVAAAGVSRPSGMKTVKIETELGEIYQSAATLELDVQQLRLETIDHMLKTTDVRLPGFNLGAEMAQLECLRQELERNFASDPILQAATRISALPLST